MKHFSSLVILASCMLFLNACNKDEKDGPAPTPEITGFSPDSGQEGDTITITGENFNATASENTVKFSGTSATVTTATATELTVTVPEGAATGKLTVSVGEQTATSADDFTVIQILEVSSFSPESGVAGDTVTITGKNFSAELAENKVKFGGITATVTSATATKLTVIVPDKAATGKINVSVNSLTASSGSNFTVIKPLAIHDFSPISGVAGDTVTITGENFSPELTVNTVKIGEATATVIEANATQLKITVPEEAQTGVISVTVDGKTATTGEDVFAVTYPPVISSFTPDSGEVSSTVTISGENFSDIASENTVKIGSTIAEVTAATTTQLTVTVPEGATTGAISVTVDGHTTSTGTNMFSVIYPPTISSFSPIEGGGGDKVTITGENFKATASENIVKFNGVSAMVTKASAISITVVVPSSVTTGKITVTVNGKMVTSTDDFTVIHPPKENFALTATASASSTYSGYSPDNVNDGDEDTSLGGKYSWTNAHDYGVDGRLPQWVALDFGTSQTFTKIVLYSSNGYIIQDFEIQYWDGANWVTIQAVEGNTELISTYTFGAIESDKVRIYATKGSPNQSVYARINELEVWDK